MIAEPTPKTWTYAEVRAIEDDVQRELHNGEIYQMPSPNLNHQSIILQLAVRLTEWGRAHGGKVYLSPVDLYVSETEYYIPDLVFYTATQMESGEVEADPNRLRVAPSIVVEVLSRSTARNDRTLKTRAYAAFGIAHYWIVDPNAQILEAFELVNGRYTVAGAIGAGESYQPGGFDELLIVADELFSSVARD